MHSVDPNKLLGVIITIFPIITFIVSILLRLIISNRIIILCIVFATYLVLLILLFNSSFLVWCFIYTAIALIGTFIGDFIKRRVRR